MGNFCTSTAVHDGGEEWGKPLEREDNIVLFDDGARPKNSDKHPSTSSSQVKIKVSKRQLEELMSRFDMHGLSSQQLLARLIMASSSSSGGGGGDECFRSLFRDPAEDEDGRRHCWRPVLQSIPEVNCASDSFDC